MPKDDREDDHEMRPLFADEDEVAATAQTAEAQTGVETTVTENAENAAAGQVEESVTAESGEAAVSQDSKDK